MKAGDTEKINLLVSSVFLQKHSNRYMTFLKTWFPEPCCILKSKHEALFVKNSSGENISVLIKHKHAS